MSSDLCRVKIGRHNVLSNLPIAVMLPCALTIMMLVCLEQRRVRVKWALIGLVLLGLLVWRMLSCQ